MSGSLLLAVGLNAAFAQCDCTVEMNPASAPEGPFQFHRAGQAGGNFNAIVTNVGPDTCNFRVVGTQIYGDPVFLSVAQPAMASIAPGDSEWFPFQMATNSNQPYRNTRMSQIKLSVEYNPIDFPDWFPACATSSNATDRKYRHPQFAVIPNFEKVTGAEKDLVSTPLGDYVQVTWQANLEPNSTRFSTQGTTPGRLTTEAYPPGVTHDPATVSPPPEPAPGQLPTLGLHFENALGVRDQCWDRTVQWIRRLKEDSTWSDAMKEVLRHCPRDYLSTDWDWDPVRNVSAQARNAYDDLQGVPRACIVYYRTMDTDSGGQILPCEMAVPQRIEIAMDSQYDRVIPSPNFPTLPRRWSSRTYIIGQNGEPQTTRCSSTSNFPGFNPEVTPNNFPANTNHCVGMRIHGDSTTVEFHRDGVWTAMDVP